MKVQLPARTLIIISALTFRTASSFAIRRHSLHRSGFSSTTRQWLSNAADEASEDDIKRWERMYYDQGSSSQMDNQELLSDGTTVPPSEVRVVTFDLDNTLWKTGATISAANDALAAFLEKEGIAQPERVEKMMGKLFQAEKRRYAPMTDDPSSPVLLTMLRKEAIQYILESHNDYSIEQSSELAEKAFDVWTNARHDIIPCNFADSVVPCLEKIRSLTCSKGNPVLIGAITDGNSNPTQVPVLEKYFDFVVNAEGVGVSKPDKRVYVSAMAHVATQPNVQDIFGSIQDSLTPENVESTIGRWWVHIGDDFTKDIVAAKDMKMRTIWARELILDKLKAKSEVANDKSSTNERTVQDLVKDLSEKRVLEMSVGADDYLADAMQKEFADAIVDRFEHLSDVLFGWHEEALQTKQSFVDNASEAVKEVTEVVESPLSVTISEQVSIPTKDDGATAPKKFCMFCGTKLAIAAKFCSSCGEKQPDM
mmetsp:Transcript_1683/g.2289  ORF Transcript_1683/g.2289 Transcript_1683/m.2289 type:complete len:481 (+) Transcript_1683:94-1536(+)